MTPPPAAPVESDADHEPVVPSIYTGYVAGVAANVEKFGLAFALETCLEMYICEFQDELSQLKQAAIAGLATRDFAPIVELAHARGIAAFTETDAETMLRGLAEAEPAAPTEN